MQGILDLFVEEQTYIIVEESNIGPMNSNNWLSFPLSPTHSSLPAHLQTTPSHHFSLGLVNDHMENPFQTQGIFAFIFFLWILWPYGTSSSSSFTFILCFTFAEWNLMNTHANSEVPKIADFLGVSKSENQSDLVAFNELQANDSGYLFENNSLVPLQNPVIATSSQYEFQENANSLQSLTLSMGSGKGSACEASADSPSNVEATPRRSLDTFGQRTSIYRGVTRFVYFLVSIHSAILFHISIFTLLNL